MSGFHVGDEVFGIAAGSNAEYVTVRESDAITAKPAGLTFEQAAAVPDGSLLALSCVRPAVPLQGKRVLVYGAAGSIGTAAVQLLAHHFEAEVTGVCDTKDVELVRSLGAREVLDRFREDFTSTGETYDVVFDAVGKHSFRRCRRSLEPGGIYVSMDSGSCTTCRCWRSRRGSSAAGARRSGSAATAGTTSSWSRSSSRRGSTGR